MKLIIKAMRHLVEIEGRGPVESGSEIRTIEVFRDTLDSLISNLIVARDHIDRSVEPREIKW